MTPTPKRLVLVLAPLLALLAACLGPAGGPAPESVVGSWELERLGDATVIPGTQVTLQLDAEGGVSGSAGVNRYFGRYERGKGDALSFSGMGATRMFRDQPAGVMQQEIDYLTALDEVDRVACEDGRLRLQRGGHVLVELVAAGG